MENPNADFGSYTLEDFIAIPEFILWVTTPDDELNIFWLQVQNEYPSAQSVIADAKRIVLSMQFRKDEMEPEEQQILWSAIEQHTRLHKKTALQIPLWLRAIAAIFLFGLIGVTLLLYNQMKQVVISTAFGQLKTLTLPDGSIVTLNANSKIHYPAKWAASQAREVWINGEAFFKVNHLHQSGPVKESDRFIVHAEKVNVEVLGTTFNVNSRRGKIQVALITGRVGVEIKGSESTQVRLLPGELAEYPGHQQPIKKRAVIADDYILWKDGKMHFNNLPMTEVFHLIEDNYGYKAILKDPSIGKRRLSGSFSLSNEDKFFRALSLSMRISIQKNESTHQLIVN